MIDLVLAMVIAIIIILGHRDDQIDQGMIMVMIF
jgi:hypothetical protein